MINTRHLALLGLASALFVAPHARGWGGPHSTITQAALKALPAWQQDAFGSELKPLGSLYCAIPDLVYSRKELAPYAMMDTRPGTVYLVGLHLPSAPPANYELLAYFLECAVGALRTNNVPDAARYAGTVVHMLEDWSCPAHSVPNDNMFTLFKQFLPPPEPYRHTPLHSPLENGTFAVTIDAYRPNLLGTAVDEAAFNLLRRAQEGTVYARAQVIPIIQALYAADTNACNAAQQTAALYGAQIVADALYTLVCIAQGRIDPAEAASLRMIDLSAFAPLEAPDLYLPQSTFFSKPYWGYASTGTLLKDGKTAVPLKLRTVENGRDAVTVFERGVGVGTRSVLTYLIPADVYERFTVSAGLHADLGGGGQVRFEIRGNGQPLVSLAPLTGGMPAHAVDVSLAGITNLQLTATSAGGDGTGNYAVWGAPLLVKAPSR